MKAHWLELIVENPEPRRPLEAVVVTSRNETLVLTGYRPPNHPQGHFAYEATDVDGRVRYVFESEIVAQYDAPRPKPRLVVDNTRRAA